MKGWRIDLKEPKRNCRPERLLAPCLNLDEERCEEEGPRSLATFLLNSLVETGFHRRESNSCNWFFNWFRGDILSDASKKR